METRYRDIPLLSFLIAQIAPYFKNNYFLTGTLLIPIFASLFILPLGFYFFRVGLPISGLLGGLIGGTVEMLPLDVDDNFSIPVVSGFAMWLLFIVMGI